MRIEWLVAALFLTVPFGCVSNTPINPSFPITADQAHQVLQASVNNPKPLDRPLVIVGGFADPGFAAAMLASDFKAYTHDDRVIGISLGFSIREEEFRTRIMDAVDKAFPGNDPNLTTDVDVIGYSMGGLSARDAALFPTNGRRLRIHRLFTISSPHRGAVCTSRVPFTVMKLQEQMTPGSAFLNSINNSADANSQFPIYSYVCLGDDEVGAENASPPGMAVWWVSRPMLLDPHDWAFMDPRIRADILRRLRDETPLSTDPPAPLPVTLDQTGQSR
jgi:pimeloyl-ACP methyl ester carboxylesterase